jgi:hypothetical protein
MYPCFSGDHSSPSGVCVSGRPPLRSTASLRPRSVRSRVFDRS